MGISVRKVNFAGPTTYGRGKRVAHASQWEHLKAQHHAIWQSVRARHSAEARDSAHAHIEFVRQSMVETARVEERLNTALRRLGEPS